MKKCIECSNYTLAEDRCPKCGGALAVPSPPKFSLRDPHYSVKLEAYMMSQTSSG